LIKVARVLLCAALFCLAGCGLAQASPHGWADLLDQWRRQDIEDRQLIERLHALASLPTPEQGPAQIEDMDYYSHELLLDENWEQWLIFQRSTLTIIPLASARFYIYADAEVERLKRPGVRVIMERPKAAPKPADDDDLAQNRLKRMSKGLKDIGLAGDDPQAESVGWNVLRWFADPDDSARGGEREFDWWQVGQKFVFVAALVLGCLIFVEMLRMVFGAGARAIGDGQRRRKRRLLRRSGR